MDIFWGRGQKNQQ